MREGFSGRQQEFLSGSAAFPDWKLRIMLETSFTKTQYKMKNGVDGLQ